LYIIRIVCFFKLSSVLKALAILQHKTHFLRPSHGRGKYLIRSA
jgi:hypothetical protein